VESGQTRGRWISAGGRVRRRERILFVIVLMMGRCHVVRSNIVTGPEFTSRKEFNDFHRGGPQRLTLLLSMDGEHNCHFHAKESKSINCCL
jgi:hypothetical protein